MNVCEPFVRRPVMTTLFMLSIVVAGLFSYRLLPVSDLPAVDFPTITVSANLPGASPETMASAVATPLEKQFSTIASLDSMNSTSGVGVTSITLQFALDRSIDAAAQDVQAAIAAATRRLPPEMTTPPSFRKVNPADSPVFYIALTSETRPTSDVDEFAQTLMGQRLSTIEGVAQVQVFGSQKYAVRAQLDPNRLAARGIGLDEVAEALASGNVNQPTGTLYGASRAYNIESDGQLQDAAAYRPLIVAWRNGSPVRLGELGRVIDSVETDKTASWFNGRRGVVLAIQRQPGTNTVALVDRITTLLPTFEAQLPGGIVMEVVYDRSLSIRHSVRDVQFTLLLALALVVMVIFLFLRNLPATLIPSLALPVSIIGTFAVMYLFGYSLNNLSLMALTLAVGFVVDDAIVMLENIQRRIEGGEGVWEATLKGSREIGFTIVSMTLSLAAVFIPILFMQGIVGRLLHEFAVTIMAAILVSGLVSLTLTPMLCSRMLKPGAGHVGHPSPSRVFNALLGLYDRSLGWVLRHQTLTLVSFVGLLVLTAWLFTRVPSGFLPNDDTAQLFGFTQASPDISYDAMAEKHQQAAEIIRRSPHVENVLAFMGATGSSQTLNNGRLIIRLKPHGERPSPEQVIQDLRPQLASIPGLRVFLQNVGIIRLGRLTKSQYQYSLQDADINQLYQWAPVLENALRELPGFQDVNSDLQLNAPSVLVEIDRARAASLGITPRQIEDALYDAYGARQVSTIYTSSNQYAVIMELMPQYQRDPSALSLLHVRASSGALVPLGALAKLSNRLGPLTIEHQGQLPAVTLSFNLAPGVSLGDAVKQLEKTKTELKVPESVIGSFSGTAQVFQDSQAGMVALLLASVLVIYLILGILYESYLHPLTILSGLPTAALGALLTLKVFDTEMGLYAIVGMIMLIGISKKNAIMMIDFALEAERQQKMEPLRAIHQAGLVRFRPIMMTTMAALLGTLPIAIGYGAGAEGRQPLGLVVVGGLLVSQVLTLYYTPVIYLALGRLAVWMGRWRQRGLQTSVG